MTVISIIFTSQSQTMHKSVVFVVLKDTKYTAVPHTSNVLHYLKLHGTTNMSIPSLYVILPKMTLVSILMTSVKKKEIPSNGSTTVKIAVILLIPNLF
ncbi:hypothetical protein CFP56_029732 [Quercus suber]|uniref:Uncharacterized protein n=1 Tax=Quercus suber TaxID=58331 RepID=A0AAW0LUH9_QUESU